MLLCAALHVNELLLKAAAAPQTEEDLKTRAKADFKDFDKNIK